MGKKFRDAMWEAGYSVFSPTGADREVSRLLRKRGVFIRPDHWMPDARLMTELTKCVSRPAAKYAELRLKKAHA